MLPSLKLTAKAPENEWLEYFLVSFLGQKAYPLNELERFANTKQHRVVVDQYFMAVGLHLCNISSKFILPALLDIQYLSPWNCLGQITSSLPLFDHLRSNPSTNSTCRTGNPLGCWLSIWDSPHPLLRSHERALVATMILRFGSSLFAQDLRTKLLQMKKSGWWFQPL